MIWFLEFVSVSVFWGLIVLGLYRTARWIVGVFRDSER